MRRLLLVVVLAACSHARPSGPAWPAPAKPDKDNIAASDGGESLAPHESKAIAAVIEKAEEPTSKAASQSAPATAAAPSEEKPAVSPATPPPPVDDVIMSDEIIIEIDD
jgi:hypothetical protein